MSDKNPEKQCLKHQLGETSLKWTCKYAIYHFFMKKNKKGKISVHKKELNSFREIKNFMENLNPKKNLQQIKETHINEENDKNGGFLMQCR